jgi:tetratricopeptide (TPR) repeat protein
MGQRLAAVISATLVLTPAALAGQGRWIEAKCDVKPGHYLVNSGVLYLRDAAKTRFDDQREKDLRDAYRVLDQALTTGGQEKNPAAWYYLGRYYVVRDDALGADSAFTKAEALLPDCKDDIQFWRRNSLWVPAFNAGVAALNAQNYDSAIAAFRIANQVYAAEPQGFTSMAAAFFNGGHSDSAAKYFRRAAEVAADNPKFANERKDAMFNLGNSFYVAKQYDSAAAAYAEYLRAAPNDPQALTRLGDVLAAAGHQDSAMSVYREVVAHADSVDPLTLFNVGVSIYNAAPHVPDTAAMGSSCRTERRAGRTLTAALRRRIAVACDSVTGQAMGAQVVADTNYRLAAKAFQAGLARDPYSRDGLFNLGNSYLALHQADSSVTDSIMAAAQRLIVVDPLNRNSMRLLAQAWQLKGKRDSVLHYVTLADSLLPVDVTIGSFTPGDQSASVSGILTNFHAEASPPMHLVFEFVNGSGEVVATQTLDVPSLQAGDNHPFQLQAIGAGIVAWRYKQG